MEINGKSVKGVFLYDSSVTYEEGDFVIEGDTLYIAQKSTNIAPSSDTGSNYKIYLGSDIISGATDFEDYASGSGEDMYVSAQALGSILQNYIGGFSGKGLIKGSINSSSEIDEYALSYYGNTSETNLSDEYTDPLDKIMVSFNSCYFVVDRAAVSSILGATSSDYNSESLILRQYAYATSDSSSSIVKVQELIDFSGGSLRYRYMETGGEPSTWTNVSTNPDFLIQIKKYEALYQSKLQALEAEKITLEQSYKNKKATLTVSKSTVDIDQTSQVTISSSDYNSGDKLITVVYCDYNDSTDDSGNSVHQNIKSVILDVSADSQVYVGTYTDSGETKDNYLQYTSGTDTLSFTDTDETDYSGTYKILDVYYKVYYTSSNSFNISQYKWNEYYGQTLTSISTSSSCVYYVHSSETTSSRNNGPGLWVLGISSDIDTTNPILTITYDNSSIYSVINIYDIYNSWLTNSPYEFTSESAAESMCSELSRCFDSQIENGTIASITSTDGLLTISGFRAVIATSSNKTHQVLILNFHDTTSDSDILYGGSSDWYAYSSTDSVFTNTGLNLYYTYVAS